MSETTVEKPRQLIVKIGAAAPYNGALGVKVLLACGHIFVMHGADIEVTAGTLECGRCLPRTCAWCNEPLLKNEPMAEYDQGVYHEECEVRALHGPASHFMQECPCFGGTRGDPPEMSKRDSARLALEARNHLIAAQGEKIPAGVAEILSKAFKDGRLVDLGVFRVKDDGTIEKAVDGDDDDDEDDEDDED